MAKNIQSFNYFSVEANKMLVIVRYGGVAGQFFAFFH